VADREPMADAANRPNTKTRMMAGTTASAHIAFDAAGAI
jgi:hypothetical protein